MSELSRAAARAATAGEARARYARVRGATGLLASRLSPEDQVVQSMPDASPTKWHLAHTTWFFETFVLAPFAPPAEPFDPSFAYLFNSYYEAEGPRHCRGKRGLLSRPTLDEVAGYRRHVDQRVLELLSRGSPEPDLLARVELGLQHEQQHQELLLTDILHLFTQNPLRPAFRKSPPRPPPEAPRPGASARPAPGFVRFEEGLVRVGHEGKGFAFDNEGPRHRVFAHAFELSIRPVSAGDYLAFMADRGYERPELWLSEGFARARASGWRSPPYWETRGDTRFTMTLDGMQPLLPDEPVCHLSYFEADAYARWAGARLPTEVEWEIAAQGAEVFGNFVESEALRPLAAPPGGEGRGPLQLFGDVWEWTASPYAPYPGFRAPEGALGEYNAKFMCNQFVLRGGSCATPGDHVRATYRNFFPPDARWQFSGLRLCRDAAGARG